MASAVKVESRVREIICEQLGVSEDEVQAEASFIEDIGADSLDIVELVMALEEEFDVNVEEEELEGVTTIQGAFSLVESKL